MEEVSEAMQRSRSPLALLAGVMLVVAACQSAAPSAAPSTAPSQGASAPASSAPSAATPVNLVLRYCWSGDGEVKAMQSIIDKWNAANPAIQVRGISGSIKAEEIAGAVAGGAPPDMVIMCNNEAVPGFAHDGVIQPMDDLLTQIDAKTDDILPASLAWMTYQGKLYGLPFLQDTWGFFWNTDAFKEVGLDPTKPPTTLDELWTDAQKLTKRNADGSLARAGFIPDYPGKNLTELSELFGCQYYDESTKKVTVNSDACVNWFKWYKSWYDEYNKKGELTNLVASKGSEDEDLFYTGKVAMGLFGEWVPGAAYAPNFAPNLHYETAPFPAIDPATYGAGFVNGNAFFIPTGSKDAADAAKFGMYLMTDDPSRIMAVQNASVPELKSLVSDPQLTSVPHFGTFLQIANHAKTWVNPMISQWAEFHDAMDSALDSVLTAGADPKKALDGVATQIQAEIDQNGP
jgi:multiple sugar transport system substrate-binding protein